MKTKRAQATSAAMSSDTPVPSVIFEPTASFQNGSLSAEELHLQTDGEPFLKTGQTKLAMEELDGGEPGQSLKWRNGYDEGTVGLYH